MSNTNTTREALCALFLDAMQWGRSYGTHLNLTDETLTDVSEGFADKALAATVADKGAETAPDERVFDHARKLESIAQTASMHSFNRQALIDAALFLRRLRLPPEAAQPAPSATEGMVLVPREPTLDMGWAYLDAAREQDPHREHAFNHAGYRAMIAAAQPDSSAKEKP